MLERKLIVVNCLACDGAGVATYGDGRRRCSSCRGRRTVKLPNPRYVAPGERPSWFQLGGPEGWAREVRRQLELGNGRCWSSAASQRFHELCAMLEPWRLRSRVHCPAHALEAIAPIVEQAFANGGRLNRPGSFPADTGWSKAELGELIVELRNRRLLWSLGRLEAKAKGPRFDPALIPDDALERLIQRHPDLELVDRQRAERNRRALA